MSGRTEYAPSTGAAWKRRLDRVNAFPTQAEMDTYLRETATVALHKVAMQMRARGYEVLLPTSELPELDLPPARPPGRPRARAQLPLPAFPRRR